MELGDRGSVWQSCTCLTGHHSQPGLLERLKRHKVVYCIKQDLYINYHLYCPWAGFPGSCSSSRRRKVLWWSPEEMAGAEAPAAPRRSILQASSFCLHNTFSFSEQGPAPNQALLQPFFSSIYLLSLYPGTWSAVSILSRCCSVIVISLPLSHMKTKVERIWVLSSVSRLTSSSPGYTVIILSVPCGLSSAVERVLQDLLGAGASEQRRVCISTGAALTFHPETESKFTNPFLQWLPGNQWTDPKLEFSSSWLTAKILKAAGLVGFFSPSPNCFTYETSPLSQYVKIHHNNSLYDMLLKEICVTNTWINAYMCAEGAPWATAFVSTNFLGQIPDCRSSRYE